MTQSDVLICCKSFTLPALQQQECRQELRQVFHLIFGDRLHHPHLLGRTMYDKECDVLYMCTYIRTIRII